MVDRWILGSNILTLKVPITTIAKYANTDDPDETAHNELSHLDLQCLRSKSLNLNVKQFFQLLQT